MSIRFANGLTYSESLFPSTGLESKHSSSSPPSTQSYLGNCRFLANSKQQSTHWSSRSPSPLNSNNSGSSYSSSTSKPIACNPQGSKNRTSQTSRTPSPPNSNCSSRSTSPRTAFNAVKPLISPTYESGSDEPVHHYINFNHMRRRNGGEMTQEDYKLDMVFYQEATQHEWKIRNKAMIELNAKWNASLDANVLDLHHLLPSQVHRVIEAKVQEIKNRNWKRLYIVTGVGKNSEGRIAKLRPVAERYAEKNGYRFIQMDGNHGVLIMSIARR